MRRRLPFCVCVLAALAVLAACGEDREGSVEESGGAATTGTGTTRTGTTGTGTTTAPAAAGPAVATLDVTETEFELEPQNPRIAKAGVVTFSVRNAGRVPHALEVEGPEGEVETDTIAPGKRATLKADLSRPGTYTWYCPVGDHEQRGMKGRITVAGGGKAAREGRSGKRDGGSREGDSGSGGAGGY